MTYTLSISKDGEIIVRLGVSADEALAIVGRALPKTDAPEVQPDVPQGPENGQRGSYQKKGKAKVERSAIGRKKTQCGACGEVGHSSRSPDCPAKTGSAAAAPTAAETRTTKEIKRLLKEGHDDDFVAAETLSSPRVVTFMRKQMVSRGEL